jgi:hypothetical protein
MSEYSRRGKWKKIVEQVSNLVLDRSPFCHAYHMAKPGHDRYLLTVESAVTRQRKIEQKD